MNDAAKKAVDGVRRYLFTFIKWTFLSVVIGVICGCIGTVFHICVEKATEIRTDNSWIIFLLPFAGLFIVFLYTKTKQENDKGTNLVIESVRSAEKIPAIMAPLIFIATFLTHLFGGSAGREGAALQIGGSVAATIGRACKMKEDDIRVITMCGMSAMFAALFGTPLTATVFAMEVISVGVIYYTALVPCSFAAVVGTLVSKKFGITPVAYTIANYPSVNIKTIISVALLALLCALVSIVFCITMAYTGKMYKKYIPNQYLRVAVGGVIVVILTVMVGTHDYNGAGMNIVEKAINGKAANTAFIMKIIFTAVTLGAGFRGGEIVPTFFIGATFGCVVGPLIGLDPGFAAAVGIIAMFCSVVNCPLASMILGIELFSSSDVVLFAIACAVSYMMSGYYGLYSSQKIMYSKLAPNFINRNAKH